MIEPDELRVDGQGDEVVVLLHGWPDTLRLWDGQVAALQDRYRCVRFTWPGFECRRPGPVPSLDELVGLVERVVQAHAGDRPVTLLLHDWGCVFGYEFAMRHPQRVKRVVAADIGDAGSRAHVASLSLPQKVGMVGYQSMLAGAWKLGGKVGDLMTRQLAAAMRVPADPATLHSGMNWPYHLQWSGGLKRLHRVAQPPWPLLFLYGRRKPFLFHSPAWAEAVARRPGSAVHGLDAGHWLMLSRRDEFNRRMRDWLDTGG